MHNLFTHRMGESKRNVTSFSLVECFDPALAQQLARLPPGGICPLSEACNF